MCQLDYLTSVSEGEGEQTRLTDPSLESRCIVLYRNRFRFDKKRLSDPLGKEEKME